MSMIAAYMVPHPPMIIPEVGRGSEAQIEATRAAYMQVAEEIAALKPDIARELACFIWGMMTGNVA